MIKIYQYPKCSTCKKAIQFLKQKNVEYKAIDISEKSPTKTELKKMIKALGGETKKLFNTSGKIYRERKLSQKVASMSEQDIIAELANEGMLVKRPFALYENEGIVGFKEDEWKKFIR